MKRVPIPVVILLGLGAVALPWWLGTRHMDFLTPPTEFQLARVRSDVATSFPKRAPAAPVRPETDRAFLSPIKPPPVIDPGEYHAPAPLDAYREHAKAGAKAYIELAALLEEQSANPRALLAWERVLDACKPEPSQRTAALAGIQRLRPLVAPWRVDPQEAQPLVLVAKLSTSTLPPEAEALLAEAAGGLIRHSTGLLRATPLIELPEKKPAPPKKRRGRPATEDPPAEVPAPPVLSLLLRGEQENGPATASIDLPLVPDAPLQRRDLLAAIYKLVASQLAATTALTPPAPLAVDDDPQAALHSRITRFAWSEFGKSLHSGDPP